MDNNTWRAFLKSNFGKESSASDQQKGIPQPSLVKPPMTDSTIRLPDEFDGLLVQDSYRALLSERRSERMFAEEDISLAQLAFLLWSTQGIQAVKGKNSYTQRPVASGGARHPFETYLVVRHVAGLLPGLYHYLPQENQLEFLRAVNDKEDGAVTSALSGQSWAALAPVVVFWTCVPYRSEWRYSEASHKVIALDAGHVGQNFYLSAKALGLGGCCIAAYNQEECDALLGIDGEDEFLIYAAAAGKIKPKPNSKMLHIAKK